MPPLQNVPQLGGLRGEVSQTLEGHTALILDKWTQKTEGGQRAQSHAEDYVHWTPNE